jgi:glycosyltransferase involved in cell wall biosynthesis
VTASLLDHEPVENAARRADYQRLCDGEHVDGPKGTVVFAVYTTDLDLGRGDVYVAAGLGLALVEQGYGVQLVPRSLWHTIDAGDVFVAMLPEVDPAFAPAGAWKVAWVRNETDAWAAADHLHTYDQVIASSRLSLARLTRVTERACGVVPIGVDTDLFVGGESVPRSRSVVSTAHHWGTLREVHAALMSLPDDADAVLLGNVSGKMPEGLGRWHRPPVSYFALPDVYRRAALVVDDMNATTRGYGSINSRFFEAAACGAFVVSNGSLGFADLGVTDVPRYRSPQELVRLVTDLRQDPDALERRAAKVQAHVRQHHDWRVRAGQFLDAIGEGRDRLASLPSGPSRPLHFFPDYRITNPYQDMLYADLGEVDTYPMPAKNFMQLLTQRTEAAGDPGVVHLHWTAPILQWAAGPYRAQQALESALESIAAFKKRGGRLVWTVHNVLPHDGRHLHAEITLARTLAESADLIHIMSEATLAEAAPYYDIDPAKVVLIEHSSYQGIYPNWIDREAARRKLGIHPSEKVLLALGGIRPYKGLERLLDVFDTLVRRDPSLHLLIAGKPGRQPEVEELAERAKWANRVTPRFEHLPDDQLQVWLNAADVAVLPYTNILNSGALLLAQTYGLPVVGPRGGALRELEGLEHVRLFDPASAESLQDAITDLLRSVVADPDAHASAREAALRVAAERSPELMASRFADAVRPLLDARA